MSFFDPEQPVERRMRSLPHWQQPDAIVFVTFRLADAIPAKALAGWAQDRRSWLVARGVHAEGDLNQTLEKLPEDQRRRYLQEFGKRFHDLLDAGHGSCALAEPQFSGIVENALRHFDGERYHLGPYVVMPNHVHILLSILSDHSLSDILKS